MEVAISCKGLYHTYGVGESPFGGFCSSAHEEKCLPLATIKELVAVAKAAETESAASAAAESSSSSSRTSRTSRTSTSSSSPQTPDKPSSPNPRGFSLYNLSFNIQQGSRVLLVGSNGAGKSTLISILGGQKLPKSGEVLVLGKNAFRDPSLGTDVCCINTWWSGSFTMDVGIGEVLYPFLKISSCLDLNPNEEQNPNEENPKKQNPKKKFPSCCCNERFRCSVWRANTLLHLLQLNPLWRVAYTSTGEKKRAQLVVNLANPRRVYLLDEANAELDIVSRSMLYRFLLMESQTLNSTIIFSSHIFDGLLGFTTHILYLIKGQMGCYKAIKDIPELQEPNASLFSLIHKWMLEEQHNKALLNSLNPKP